MLSKEEEEGGKKKKDEQTASVLRSGQISPSATPSATKTRTCLASPSAPSYEHVYKRQVVDTLVILVEEDKHTNFS